MIEMTKLTGLALAIVGSVSGAAESDIERPFEKNAWHYNQMLLSRQFSELERIAEEARRTNSTISDGQPRLATVYGGVAGCVSSACRNRFTEEQWQQRRRLLLEWRRLMPRSITAEIAAASMSLEHAWAVRGGGFANSVGKNAWPVFRERVEIARIQLEEVSAPARQDAGWYAAMLQVAKAQGWPSKHFSSLYMEGRRRHPSYISLYLTASSYFSPRWYGSLGHFQVMVEEAVTATRAQLGETLYARLNWNVWSNDMFQTGQVDWIRMKAGFERLIADYPDPWNINHYAKFACLAGDARTVLDLTKKIGARPIESAWWGSTQYYDQCVALARQRPR